MTASSMNEALKSVAQLCYKASFIHLQLVAWAEHFENGISEDADSVEE